MSHQKKHKDNSHKQKKNRNFRGQSNSSTRIKRKPTEFELMLKDFLVATNQTHLIPR